MKFLIIFVTTLLLTGCFDSSDLQSKTDTAQLGKVTFEENCVQCHGKQGEGLTQDWKKRQANGMFPAPPVNGSAHAWHHSPESLMNTINHGGAKLGGWMPAFKDQLDGAEKQALLDYIYSLWPKDIQQKYDSRFK